MARQCSKCKKSAVTFIRYNGTHLCKDHFNTYIEKRVKKDIKKQGKTGRNKKIGIALSGGKDSTVALFLSHKIFSHREQTELYALSVDEGIAGYRDQSLIFAQKNCERFAIPHQIISFREIFGTTLDAIALKRDEIGECSYCGVFRRVCLNKTSKEIGIDKLVTGHNLDDIAQSILMNFINGDIEKLARLGPHQIIKPGLVPRMMPLRVIPEKEVALYALLNNIIYYDGECPYAHRAYRGRFREIIDHLEEKNPGTRHSILKSYESLKDLLITKFPPTALSTCTICAEPTSQNICKACILKKRLTRG